MTAVPTNFWARPLHALIGGRAARATGALRIILFLYVAQMLLGLAVGFAVPFLRLWGAL
jgi:hypothetical protein